MTRNIWYYLFLFSNFSEIFDVEWFISHLSRDVKVIKELPRKGGKIWIPYNMRVPRKCNERCYQIRVLPVLLKKHVSYYLKVISSAVLHCVLYKHTIFCIIYSLAPCAYNYFYLWELRNVLLIFMMAPFPSFRMWVWGPPIA